MSISWCRCQKPWRDPNDDEAFCFRCGRPIEATDPETGAGLERAEDEDEL